MRGGRDRARGRDARRPHAAVRLPQRRVRHVQGTDPRRRGRLRPAPGVDAHRRREAHRPRALLLREAVDRRHDRGARGAPRRRHRDQAPAVPHRVDREGGARRRDRALQAAGQRAAAVPRGPVRRLPAEGRQAAQLLARHAAARRQAARAAHPARPAAASSPTRCSRNTRGARSCASRARSGRSTCARTSDKPIDLRRRRHRLRADQGDDRARAPPQDRPREMVLYWGARSLRRPLPARPARQVADRAPELHVHPGAVGAQAGRRLARPDGLRAPGGDGRLPGPVRATRCTRAARRR